MEFLSEHPASDVPQHGVRLRVGVGAAIVLVAVAGGLAVLITALSPHPTGSASPSSESSYSTKSSAGAAAPVDSSANASTAFVQVVGQVQKPGLYELPIGDRIVDAIAAAGGFTPLADQSSLNLAQVIADGQQLVVAAKGSAPAAAGASPGSGTGGSGSVVDINTADASALETLDGIGPALAERILAYRTSHGGFRSVGDLQKVTGIGPKKYAAIKGSVGV